MKVIVVKDYEEGARKAADLVEEVIRSKPDCTLGLATGSSPLGLYRELARRCKEENLDFSKVHSVNLDEYVGLKGDHKQSYRYFMDTNLFNAVNIDKKNTYVAKGIGKVSDNLKEFNDLLAHTVIDLQLLGVGSDGHLGFNEPGTALQETAHEEILDDSTLEANKRFFASKSEVPTSAITMGMGDIMKAKKLLLVISGNKREAAEKLLLGKEITTLCPCTFLKAHPDATVIIEESLCDAIGYPCRD